MAHTFPNIPFTDPHVAQLVNWNQIIETFVDDLPRAESGTNTANSVIGSLGELTLPTLSLTEMAAPTSTRIRFTIPGLYRVGAVITFPSSDEGTFSIRQYNGAAIGNTVFVVGGRHMRGDSVFLGQGTAVGLVYIATPGIGATDDSVGFSTAAFPGPATFTLKEVICEWVSD